MITGSIAWSLVIAAVLGSFLGFPVRGRHALLATAELTWLTAAMMSGNTFSACLTAGLAASFTWCWWATGGCKDVAWIVRIPHTLYVLFMIHHVPVRGGAMPLVDPVLPAPPNVTATTTGRPHEYLVLGGGIQGGPIVLVVLDPQTMTEECRMEFPDWERFHPASAHHRLIEKGWMITPDAIMKPTRASGWAWLENVGYISTAIRITAP